MNAVFLGRHGPGRAALGVAGRGVGGQNRIAEAQFIPVIDNYIDHGGRPLQRAVAAKIRDATTLYDVDIAPTGNNLSAAQLLHAREPCDVIGMRMTSNEVSNVFNVKSKFFDIGLNLGHRFFVGGID